MMRRSVWILAALACLAAAKMNQADPMTRSDVPEKDGLDGLKINRADAKGEAAVKLGKETEDEENVESEDRILGAVASIGAKVAGRVATRVGSRVARRLAGRVVRRLATNAAAEFIGERLNRGDVEQYADTVAAEALSAVSEVDGVDKLTEPEQEALTTATAEVMHSTLSAMGVDSMDSLSKAETVYDDDTSSTTRRRRNVGVGGFGGSGFGGSGFGGGFGRGGFLTQLGRFSRISPFSLFNRISKFGFPFRPGFGFGSGFGSGFGGGFGSGFKAEEDSDESKSETVEKLRSAAASSIDEMIDMTEVTPPPSDDEKKALIDATTDAMLRALDAMGVDETALDEIVLREDADSDTVADEIDEKLTERAIEATKPESDEIDERSDENTEIKDEKTDEMSGDGHRLKRQSGFGFRPFGLFGGFPGRRGFFRRLAFNTGIPPFFFFNRFRRFGFPRFFGRRFF